MSFAEFFDDVLILLQHWHKERELARKGIPRASNSILSLPSDDGWNYYLEHGKQAELVVLERWLAEGRFDGVIAFAVSNFDGTGGDEFIRIASRALEARSDVRRLRRLWNGILANRMGFFGTPTADDEALTSSRKAARDSVITAIMEFAEVMARLGDLSQAAELREKLVLFRAGKRRQSKRPPDKRTIDESVFWEIIEEAKRGTESPAAHVEAIIERLEAFGLRDIRQFQKTLDEKMALSYAWDLWALAYIVRRGCSDDAFDYFRAWLILQGRDIFEAVVQDISALQPDESGLDPQCEQLLYAAEQAYENKKGEPMRPLSQPVPMLLGDAWEEGDLKDRFPKVCARHGYITGSNGGNRED